MAKYFGNFTGRADVAREFAQCADKYASNFLIDDGFPPDDAILFAEYETPGYDGDAFVLFERGGKLFEVHGWHCSCYGLEGQWVPEETTWAALAMRPDKEPMYDSDADAIAAYRNLIHQHTKETER